ncbi:hypothetical protein PENANT_c033G07282 [Penicillium antarcticum]|uniref:Uncharacterized protein n=1 Tax=Penicillium antarcticum TaxID=416450 RepID=A0A1V6PVN6_9EURO|nr:hypothetical protein PENANT_c033G07282 [Penicillium antarcticum]
MRYALAAPALLAVTVIAAPVSKPDEEANNLGIDNIDLPQLAVKNIPKRDEDVNIDSINPGVGIPTLTVPTLKSKRGDGDDGLLDGLDLGVDVLKREIDAEDEQQQESNDGVLGLGFLGFTKREDTLLGSENLTDDTFTEIDDTLDGILEKRDGSLTSGDGGDGDADSELIEDAVDSAEGVLGKREETMTTGGHDGGDDDLAEIVDTVEDLLEKRDDSILTDGDENGSNYKNNGNDGILGTGILRKRGDGDDDDDEDDDEDDDDEGLLGLGIGPLRKRGDGDEDDDEGLLGLGIGPLRKRGDGDDDDDDDDEGLLGLGLFDILKREQDTSIGGIGGVDAGTPVLDIVNA